MENVLPAIQSVYPPVMPHAGLPSDRVLGQAPTAEAAQKSGPARLLIRWFCLISLILLCVPLAGVVVVASYFFLGSSSTALRSAVMDSVPGRWHKHFAINVGSMTLALARFGVSFTHLPPDAKAALQCLDHGDVGIYEFEGAMSSPDYALILTTADKSMRRRGWERIVGVVEGRQFVAVYAPSKQRGEDISCCVAVLDDWNLVIVSAHGDTGPILELAQRHLHTTGLVNSRRPWLQ